MFSIERLEKLIQNAQETLGIYEVNLLKEPNSLFNKGMVKNTKNQLDELQANLVFEKQRRFKEIIYLRLKGMPAKVGTMPLELFGKFSSAFSACVHEASRRVQYGPKTSKLKIDYIKNMLDVRFERLIPGSTQLLISAKTSPDLFGHSILEEGLKNIFSVLNVESEPDLLEVSGKYGAEGIKCLDKMLTIGIENHLELDLTWVAPNNTDYVWQGTKDKLKILHTSLSKITVLQPEEIAFEGVLLTQSLKGHIEIKDDLDSKVKSISFSKEQLDSIKSLQIGDTCQGIFSKTITQNTAIGTEKVGYELVSIK
jgi:hypothetical protein